MALRLFCGFEGHLELLVRAILEGLLYRLVGDDSRHLDGEGFLHKVCLEGDLLPDLIYFGALMVT